MAWPVRFSKQASGSSTAPLRHPPPQPVSAAFKAGGFEGSWTRKSVQVP
jgi:hypothetical protein